MKFLVLFIFLVFATNHSTEIAEDVFEQSTYTPILVKIEEDENFKVKKAKTSKYTGVVYDDTQARWRAYRRRKKDRKMVYNGSYNDEETAAHASDTLARKLMKNDEQNLRLNFPDDDTEEYAEKETTSKYIGVSHNETHCQARWNVYRWSKNENKNVHNGCYKDEKTAAHASDTLARKLMTNGEQNLKLNFPGDETEVHAKKPNTSKYIGVTYVKTAARWIAHRRNKNEKKMVYNGCYKNEETAAHASDTLARKLMANGEQNHKLNFPDDDTEVYTNKLRKNKRKRPDDVSQTNENLEKLEGKKHETSFKNQLAD